MRTATLVGLFIWTLALRATAAAPALPDVADIAEVKLRAVEARRSRQYDEALRWQLTAYALQPTRAPEMLVEIAETAELTGNDALAVSLYYVIAKRTGKAEIKRRTTISIARLRQRLRGNLDVIVKRFTLALDRERKAQWEAGHYQDAFGAAAAVYAIDDYPENLFSLASICANAGLHRLGIQLFKNFVSSPSPPPELRNKADASIEMLRRLLDGKQQFGTHPVPSTLTESAPRVSGDRQLTSMEDAERVPRLTARNADVSDSTRLQISVASPPKPIHRRAWFWPVIVGGGGVLVGGAIALGVILNNQPDDSWRPHPMP